MKSITLKYAPQPLQWRNRLICVPVAMLFFILSAQAQTDAILPAIGGAGGGQFAARCSQGQFLTGFELRTGDDVDAIRPICVTAYGPAEVGPLVPGKMSFGGSGGGPRQLLCPKDAPIVTGIDVGSEGIYSGNRNPSTVSVNNIHLWCGLATTTQTPSQFPAAVFDGPREPQSAKGDITYSAETQRCPAGLVAVGINGRSGALLDALGLICGPPKLTKSIGRVREGAPTGPPLPICDRAREARARNSPVAANLEAQCRAAQLLAARRREAELLKGADMAREKPPVNSGGPIINADSNPVMVPNGQDSGTTTITWKPGPEHTYCEIYLSIDDAEWSEFARSPADAKTTTIKLGSSYTFRMMVYEGQAGTPRIITTLVVTAKR